MEDVQVFYNQEDLWQVPDEKYGDTRQAMKPYYIIIKLPGEEREEFLLMLPFTPSQKDNMIGWLSARSDLPNYGSLLVYKMPKEKLVYGPMQIEARVDQQTEISRELSLWDQRGSRVIRGNMLAIPISDTFVYIEPVYLEAKQEQDATPGKGSQPPNIFGRKKNEATIAPRGAAKKNSAALPELKRVIAALGNQVVMEENLERALAKLLEGRMAVTTSLSPAPADRPEIRQLSGVALEHYNKARDYLRQGDWAGYGRELDQLERVLRDMSRLGNGQK